MALDKQTKHAVPGPGNLVTVADWTLEDAVLFKWSDILAQCSKKTYQDDTTEWFSNEGKKLSKANMVEMVEASIVFWVWQVVQQSLSMKC